MSLHAVSKLRKMVLAALSTQRRLARLDRRIRIFRIAVGVKVTPASSTWHNATNRSPLYLRDLSSSFFFSWMLRNPWYESRRTVEDNRSNTLILYRFEDVPILTYFFEEKKIEKFDPSEIVWLKRREKRFIVTWNSFVEVFMDIVYLVEYLHN